MIKRALLFIIAAATALLSQADRMDSRWGVASHPVRKGWEYEMHEKLSASAHRFLLYTINY